jgi:transposase
MVPRVAPLSLRVAFGLSLMPLGYEVFAGNRHDATTLEEMVRHVEQL